MFKKVTVRGTCLAFSINHNCTFASKCVLTYEVGLSRERWGKGVMLVWFKSLHIGDTDYSR